MPDGASLTAAESASLATGNDRRVCRARSVGWSCLLCCLFACGGRTGVELTSQPGSATAGVGARPGSSGGDGGAAQGGASGHGGSGTAGGGATAGGGPSSGGGAPEGGGGQAGQGGQTPLWRASLEPFCSDNPSIDGRIVNLSVWSDARGVFVLVSNQTETLSFNDGKGWSTIFEGDGSPGFAGLTGFSAGPLAQFGQFPCGIEFFDQGRMTCSAASPFVQAVHTVSAKLAYAVYANRVLKFDGLNWVQFGAPLATDVIASAVWATSDVVLVAASSGRAFVYRNADPRFPELQAGLPAADHLAAWGASGTDLWLGNSAGALLHFDGRSWSTAYQEAGECNAIQGIWGTADTLFFWTHSAVRHWHAGSVQTLLDGPCDGPVTVRGVWGNSAAEVFVALEDSTANRCNNLKLLWFNGSELGPL